MLIQKSLLQGSTFNGLLHKLVAALVLLTITVSGNLYAKDILLLSLSTQQLAAGKVEVKLEFDAPPPIPTAFVLKDPDRVLVDMWGVENGTSQASKQVDQSGLRSIELVQAKGRLRLVTHLNNSVNYSSSAEGNTLTLLLDNSEEVGNSDSVLPSANGVNTQKNMPRISEGSDSIRTRVQGIDFERAENGIGRVKIKLSNDRSGVEVVEEGHNVLVNLAGALLSDQLSNRLNVQDFNTPVMFIDSFAQGESAGILIKPSAAPYRFKSYQVGRELIVDFWPKGKRGASANALRKKNATRIKKVYSGEKIDLNFQNVSIRSVLQIIAEVAQKNLVVDDSVAGTITLRLQNVPWDQALDIVLKTRGLDKRSVGNVLLVAPAAKLAERERIELEGNKQIEELSPIETDFIQIKYRKSSEMKQKLEEASLIGKRGFALADDATNVLMIRETAKQLAVIKHTLTKFDKAVAQIMIEAKLIIATRDVSKELGVRWGLGYSDGRYTVNGTQGGTAGTAPLAVDLGVTSSSAITLGYISQNGVQLGAEIAALDSTGDAEIISQPKVITTNGLFAEIKSGQQIPYQTTEDGTTTTEFKDVVLSLKVTPQITPGDNISMLLEINQDSLGTNTNDGFAVNTNSLKTSVVVKDGDTIVLGGVHRSSATNNVSKTPVLGDLPVLGRLFRNKQNTSQKNELLIFITPKLIRENLKIN